VADVLVPSFILKADRAEKHLGDLRGEIAQWADTHPYEVCTRYEGKRKVRYLHFTAQPSPEVSVIAADFVYNLRSGLDHLMAALVPSDQRDSVYFPVYFQGVWEDPIPGETEERGKERGRWRSHTSKVRPEAVTILKSLQPRERGENGNPFVILKRLSNTDGHQKLPVVISGLAGTRLIWKDAEGNPHIAPTDTGDPEIDSIRYKDGAELVFPPGAVDIHVAGSPVAAIALPEPRVDVEIPGDFESVLLTYRERVVEPLAPYVHRPGG
jgi:hypothetical protein